MTYNVFSGTLNPTQSISLAVTVVQLSQSMKDAGSRHC